jgi:hypothetical protein
MNLLRPEISFGNKIINTVFRDLIGGRNNYGVNKLYKGFGVTLSTAIPAQAIYLCSIDKSNKIMQDMFKDFPLEEHTKKSIAEQTGAMAATLLA